MRVLAVLVTLAIATSAIADEIRGKVVSIADGDTITVLDADKVQHKIRFNGIDAPEKKQAFGTRSKEELSAKIGEREVVVVWKGKDRYDRTLGDVYLGKRHINAEMVREGWAWHYKQYSKDSELSAAEVMARQKRVGLWADKEPTPPWEFRKQARAR